MIYEGQGEKMYSFKTPYFGKMLLYPWKSWFVEETHQWHRAS